MCTDPFKHTDGGWPTPPSLVGGTTGDLDNILQRISDEYMALMPEDRSEFLSDIERLLQPK